MLRHSPLPRVKTKNVQTYETTTSISFCFPVLVRGPDEIDPRLPEAPDPQSAPQHILTYNAGNASTPQPPGRPVII